MKEMGKCINDWYVARMHNDIYNDISIQYHKRNCIDMSLHISL